MEVIDPTIYTCFCSLCQVQIEAANAIPTIDIGNQIFILCPRCYEALKILSKDRTTEEISILIGNECEQFPVFDKYHPQHHKIEHLTKLANKTYKICNCCGNMLTDRHRNLPKEFLDFKKNLEKFKKAHNLEFDLCDDCLDVVTSMDSVSQNEDDFIYKLNICFKYPPLKK